MCRQWKENKKFQRTKEELSKEEITWYKDELTDRQQSEIRIMAYQKAWSIKMKKKCFRKLPDTQTSYLIDNAHY